MRELRAVPPPRIKRVVARQPIVGIDDRIAAFQLIHRASPDPVWMPEQQQDETLTVAAVLSDLTVEIGHLVADLPVFCEPEPGMLTGTLPVSPPGQRTMLEVPADLCGDQHVVDRCHYLLQEGFSIAVDQFAWHPGVEALLELADVVRIDLDAWSRQQVVDLVERCRPFDVSLLAARCRTEADMAWAAEVGFDLFQGPAVQRPVQVSGETLAPSTLTQVQLATELLDERLEFSRVEAILSRDPALVVQVLHYASLGAAGGLRREVHSVREALVLLGTRRFRQWAALTVLGRHVNNTRTDALAVALVRARMCELLAQPRGLERGFAFTAGLLSALDRLLGVPITDVEARVGLDAELSAAAFRREGPVGELVDLVAAYQDAVDVGAPTPESVTQQLGDVGLVAAMAFLWAMTHVSAIESTLAVA